MMDSDLQAKTWPHIKEKLNESTHICFKVSKCHFNDLWLSLTLINQLLVLIVMPKRLPFPGVQIALLLRFFFLERLKSPNLQYSIKDISPTPESSLRKRTPLHSVPASTTSLYPLPHVTHSSYFEKVEMQCLLNISVHILQSKNEKSSFDKYKSPVNPCVVKSRIHKWRKDTQ